MTSLLDFGGDPDQHYDPGFLNPDQDPYFMSMLAVCTLVSASPLVICIICVLLPSTVKVSFKYIIDATMHINAHQHWHKCMNMNVTLTSSNTARYSADDVLPVSTPATAAMP